MRFLASVLAITVLTPGLAGAQAGTTDGIQALIRGDYAAAVRILQPLAEETLTADPIAQFFLASLYYSGNGVVRDEMRACGLFRAAAVPESALMSQSLALAASIHRDLPLLVEHCPADAADLWGSPAPVSFTLGTNHWVKFGDLGLTVGYEGAEHLTRMAWGGRGSRFLPIRHTSLDVLKPVATRRHFIEFFAWTPSRTSVPPIWTLTWSLHEVVGLRVVPVPSVALSRVAAAAPPTSDDRVLARLRVNADSEVEQVASGTDPSTRTIPYPELRR